MPRPLDTCIVLHDSREIVHLETFANDDTVHLRMLAQAPSRCDVHHGNTYTELKCSDVYTITKTIFLIKHSSDIFAKIVKNMHTTHLRRDWISISCAICFSTRPLIISDLNSTFIATMNLDCFSRAT